MVHVVEPGLDTTTVPTMVPAAPWVEPAVALTVVHFAVPPPVVVLPVLPVLLVLLPVDPAPPEVVAVVPVEWCGGDGDGELQAAASDPVATATISNPAGRRPFLTR